MPTLTLVDDGATEPNEFRLHKRITSVGADSTNDIVLDREGIQPSHAIVQCDGGTFEIKAVDGNAAIRVNGDKTSQATLSHDDRIGLGDVEMTFSLLDSAEDEDGGGNVVEDELEGYRKLFDFSQHLLDNYELSSLLDQLLDSVIDITNADKGFLILVEDDEFSIRVARDVNQETIPDALEHVSDSIIAKVLQKQEAIIVSDAMNSDEFKGSESVVNMNLSSVMCVPLIDRGSLLGLIYVGNEHIANLFTGRHLDLLTIFAAQASLIIANAIMVRDLRLDKEMLSKRLSEMRFGSIIGASDAMREIFRKVEKVAPTDVNVLVTGETGTGKELVAREIHNRSSRFKGPFVTINCGAIPESLLESELFGHVKGAFTGAERTREGKFQVADGGTIFLDEIGEMPLNLQVKLLRVLQERQITKVGSSEPEDVDIRIIAATNKDLERAVEEGEFREDLFYRLNVIMLHLPPLKMRGDDVVLIAKHYLREICDELDVGQKELSSEAVNALKRYEWPGNVRQLENRLKKAILLSDGSVVDAEDLGLTPEMLEPILPLSEAKERFAYRYVIEALDRNDGNRTQAADELDVDPRTIFRYLKKSDEDEGDGDAASD
ncbi:MAG: sigma 54-interacting transcriptional regulator [Bradymonadaceae bacterium]